MKSYKTSGIILKRSNLGEADRIITAFTSEYGKVKFVAKGVRKINSKMGGTLEPFYLVELLILPGKSLDTLASSNIQEIFLNTQTDLERIKLSSLFSEIIDKTMPDKTPNLEIFELLLECLRQINTPKLTLIKPFFITNLLMISGLSPELFRCVKCGQDITMNNSFSVEGGGVVDQKCRPYFNDIINIDNNVIKLWRLTTNQSYRNLEKLVVTDNDLDNLESLSRQFLRHLTNKEFKSELI